MIKGLDRWLEGGNRHRETIQVVCMNGHQWEVEGWNEYGSFYANDDEDYVCQTCGKEAQDCD